MSHTAMRIAIFAALTICGAADALALNFARSGTTVSLSGPIRPGDQFKFREASDGAKLIVLNSTGGNIEAARGIARAIRAGGMATSVDASRSICASACTVIFAGGASRYYVNAGGVADHLGKMGERGLGYHEGNAFAASGRREQSGNASAGMINAYYEMGASGAASLIPKAGFRQVYYISGATAMSLGIATSAARP